MDNRTASAKLHIRIGDGVFRVGTDTSLAYMGLNLTSFPNNPRGWAIDGTGATLLGGCKDVPVIDAVDSRFGSFGYLQIIGAVPDGMAADNYPSCGLRVGRKADNEAPNQMTTDHLGIRGLFKIAACLNVASEQFSDLNCEFSNDREGDAYGYAGDAYNMLQWKRPIDLVSVTFVTANTFDIVSTAIVLAVNDNIIIRGQSSQSLDSVWFTVQSVTDTTHFRVTGNTTALTGLTGGKLYKKLFGGAIDTPGLTPFAQNSFKQQLHQQGNYRAPRGIAGIFEGCDSQHIYRSCHPTCGFYPAGGPTYSFTLTKSAHTTISGITPAPGTGLVAGHLVSFTDSGLPGQLDTRLFKLAATGTTGTFELVDARGNPVDSSGWSVTNPLQGMARQLVAGGDDATKGGFGMRMVVSTQGGCDLSEYGLHHEPGQAGETTWWASVERFESLLDPAAAPGPVLLTDVSFKEAAAQGRGGFLLAQSSGVGSLTMLGGAITLAHPQAGFGSTGHADKLLMATGAGASPWVLTNTDLVVEEIALVDVTKLAGFSGRVSAQETAFTSAVAGAYPGTLAVIQALAGQPLSAIRSSAPLVEGLLGALDRAGVLAKLDALHVFAAATEAAARVNLAAPSGGPLVYVGTGTPQFDAWQGFTGGGSSSSYLQSPIHYGDAGLRYNPPSAAMGVVSRTSVVPVQSKDLRLVNMGTDSAFVDPFGTGSTFHTLANESVEQTVSTGLGSIGFFAWSRVTTPGYTRYAGSGTTSAQPTAYVTSTGASSAPAANSTFSFLRASTHQISAAFFGGGLTQTEMNALYAALKTYLTAVGAWM